MKINRIYIIVIILVFAAAAHGAPIVPNIGDAIKQVEPPKDLPQRHKAVPGMKEKSRPSMKSTDISTVFVKGFSISGNVSISSEVLTGILNKPENINREMTFADIEAVAFKITKYYRDKGYFVAKAYIPKQRIVDGIVEIVVLEGEYGEVRMNNSSHVTDKRLRKIINKAAKDEVIKSDSIERQMLIINKTPGANLKKINVSPGKEYGSSDIDITIVPAPRIFGYLIGDNYGLRYIGRNRVMAGAGINSPFGLGDRLFISGLTSTTADLKNGRLSYMLPLNSSGLTGELSYSRTTYSLGQEYDSLDASGKAGTIELQFKYPIWLKKYQTFYITQTFASRDMEDTIDLFDLKEEKDTVAMKTGMKYKRVYPLFGFRYTTELSGEYTLGSLSFDNSAAEDIDAQGANTKGLYQKLKAEAKQKIEFNEKLSVVAALQAQQVLGNKNLDGSEDFSIGGIYGVRVFPSSEKSSENGYILNAELIYRLPKYKNVATLVSVFADHAYVKPQDDFGDVGGRSLSDAGVGVYGYYKTFFIKSYLAFAIGGSKVESEPEYNRRLLLQGGMTF